MTSRARKVLTGFFAVAFALICAFSTSTAAYAAGPANLALGKTAVADSEEASTVAAANAVDGNTKDSSSRWGSNVDSNHGPHWIYVDLGSDQKVSSAKVYWENRKATGFKIQTAAAKDATGTDSAAWKWNDVYSTSERPDSTVSTVNFDETTARYVRLYITGFTSEDPDNVSPTYATVSIYEFEVYGEQQEAPAEAKNLALKKTTKASKDFHNQNGARAVDGKKKIKGEDRWMTEEQPVQWLAVDLTKSESIKYFDLLWEDNDNYATKFKVYVTDNAAAWENPASNDAWGTAVVDESNNTKGENEITLDTPAAGRYIKLEILGMSSSRGVSLMEFEAWNEVPPAPEKEPADYLNDIKISPVTAETQKLQYELPEAPEGYEIKYNGTDYEQVIDTDGTIYRPITNVTVKASFKITNKTDHTDYAFKEFEVAVPGTMTAAENANVAPTILPELREWVGGTGSFAASSAKRVVYSDDSLKAMAEEFASDF